ncbi:MAG: hypothetical protein ACHQXA_05115 [Gemmatimonadales bacterium]
MSGSFRADYDINAPVVIRNLALGAAAAVLIELLVLSLPDAGLI